MKSKRRYEGHVLLDNRNSPGIPESQLALAGLPLTAGRGLFEAATITCAHCQAVVVIEPLRTRERAYCAKCDHYVCDRCGAVMAQTKECRSYRAMIADLQEKDARAAQAHDRGLIILP